MRTRRADSGSTTDVVTTDIGNCAKCKKTGEPGSQWIQCDICDEWFHNACCGLPPDLIPQITKAKLLLFRCKICLPVSHVTVQHAIKEALSELPNTVDKLVKDNLSTILHAVNTQSRVSTEKLERKLDIRIQNLPEPTDNTQLKRMESDENLVSDVLKHLNEWDRYKVSSIKRLGQFKSTNTRPRSDLVKFSNEWTASKVLKKAQLLKEFRTPVFISKSLTSDELALEKLILKKRWELINSGTPKQDLKILNLQLFHKDIVVDITA